MFITMLYKNETTTVEMKHFLFPGGEVHLKLISDTLINAEKVTVSCRLSCSDKLLKLLLCIDAIKRIVKKSTPIDLILPYFPYARQDRVCNPGEPFSAEVMANLINALNVNSVTVWDIHSTVTQALINNVNPLSQATLFSHCAPLIHQLKNNKLLLVSPDKGAQEKTKAIHQFLGLTSPIIQAAKERDLQSGKIIRLSFDGDVKDRALLIVDDICDGGKTFTYLAKQLKEAGAADISLYVTHGIFSKGFKVFEGLFTNLYCTDSIKNINDFDDTNVVNLNVIPLFGDK